MLASLHVDQRKTPATFEEGGDDWQWMPRLTPASTITNAAIRIYAGSQGKGGAIADTCHRVNRIGGAWVHLDSLLRGDTS